MSLFCARPAITLLAAAAVFFTVLGSRDPPPKGGPQPIPSDDPHLQPAVAFAAVTINQRCNCLYCQTVVGVTNATQQVVDGSIYKFSLELQESDHCRVDQCAATFSNDTCPPTASAKPYWCDVTVLATPSGKPPYVMEKMAC